MSEELPGIEFEKAVAAIQMQLDPNAAVTHNEIILNRLGHSRQFDVVVRGTFAGHPMLGVIECKDLKGKVGTPEIDAFVTKAQDINANFKIMMSRKGFTKPALAQCSHNGIQALSLLHAIPANRNFLVGTRWKADVTRWSQVSVTLHFVSEPNPPVKFRAETLRIGGRRVIDWFTNHLLDQEDKMTEFGWVIGLKVVFDRAQSVEVSPGNEHLCEAISFQAERVCEKLEYLVGVSGTGFFNWNSKEATFPPGTTVRTDPIPLDFTQWRFRSSDVGAPAGFLEMHIFARQQCFDRVPDAIDLEAL